MRQPEPACLVIADISGYTGFLARAELDHAQDILADLMGTVVSGLRPTFRLAKLEGDAAFVFQTTTAVDGALLQDTIERCYFRFRRRLRDIRQASTCECNACILVPALDLKFVAHHGAVIRQRIASREELVGTNVILVHRLLKNAVNVATGIVAYVAYTDACAAAMGLTDPGAAGLITHTESFEDVGDVRLWVRDLRAAWDAELERAVLVVSPDDAAATFEATFDAPPSVVWEYVTSPALRPQWQQGVTGVHESTPRSGRRGVGTVNHCLHGTEAIVEEIVDWRPFDHVTQRSVLPIANAPKLLNSSVFDDLGDGRTHVSVRFGRPQSAKDRAITDEILATIGPEIRSALAALGTLLESEMAARSGTEAGDEPVVPAGSRRNLREPIVSGG